jgi:hypothetical protein
LQHTQTVAIEAGKRLHLVALRGVIELAVGQHAIDVEAH